MCCRLKYLIWVLLSFIHLSLKHKRSQSIVAEWYFKLIQAFTGWGQRTTKPCFPKNTVIKLLFFPALQSIWLKKKTAPGLQAVTWAPPPPFLQLSLTQRPHTSRTSTYNPSPAPLLISLSVFLLSFNAHVTFIHPLAHINVGPQTDRRYFIFRRSSLCCRRYNSSPARLWDVIAFEKWQERSKCGPYIQIWAHLYSCHWAIAAPAPRLTQQVMRIGDGRRYRD